MILFKKMAMTLKFRKYDYEKDLFFLTIMFIMFFFNYSFEIIFLFLHFFV